MYVYSITVYYQTKFCVVKFKITAQVGVAFALRACVEIFGFFLDHLRVFLVHSEG